MGGRFLVSVHLIQHFRPTKNIVLMETK